MTHALISTNRSVETNGSFVHVYANSEDHVLLSPFSLEEDGKQLLAKKLDWLISLPRRDWLQSSWAASGLTTPYSMKTMNAEEVAKLFEDIRSNHGNARPFEFREIPCEAFEEPCVECVSHKPSKSGYPQFRYQLKNWRLHRLTWTLANGEIPDGWEVDHKCGNKACVNPSHLQPLPKHWHEAKTEDDRAEAGKYDDREMAIVFLQQHPELTVKETAEALSVSQGAVKKYKAELKARSESLQ